MIVLSVGNCSNTIPTYVYTVEYIQVKHHFSVPYVAKLFPKLEI